MEIFRLMRSIYSVNPEICSQKYNFENFKVLSRKVEFDRCSQKIWKLEKSSKFKFVMIIWIKDEGKSWSEILDMMLL